MNRLSRRRRFVRSRHAAAAAAAALEPLERRALLTATLFADLNQTTPNSNPSQFTAAGDHVYFTTPVEIGGETLWKSDGTAAGTTAMRTISAGTGTALTAFDGALYFVSSHVNGVQQIFRTDGTTITPVTNFTYNGVGIRNLRASGDTLFASIADGSTGEELWAHRMIGGAPVTTQVRDIVPGQGSSFPADLTDVGGTLFFTTVRIGGLRELWASDGTAAGTRRVMGNDGFPVHGGRDFTAVGNLLFMTRVWYGDTELWVSDGTQAGTGLLKDINPSGPSKPTSVTDLGGVAYFFADDGTSGTELWRSDGTEAGTWVVRDINPGAAGSDGAAMIALNGRLYFAADDGTRGAELWTSDGTEAGTHLVADVNPGGGSSSPGSIVARGGDLFFAADDGATGRELWTSDGTAGGTRLVRDMAAGAGGVSPTDLTVGAGGKVFFSARDPLLGLEPFVSDGQAAGSGVLKDIDDRTQSSGVNNVVVSNGAMYFDARLRFDNGPGMPGMRNGLMRSDGTPEGTTLVKEVRAQHLTDVDGRMFFFADGLWTSDGTPEGTVKLKQLSDMAFSTTGPAGFAALNGRFLFAARPTIHDRIDLWVSDGTPAGTHVLKTITTDHRGSRPGWFRVVDDVLYFFASTPETGHELWRTDGTAAGTWLVKDIAPGGASSVYNSTWDRTSTHAHDGALYFFADDGVHGTELWKSDGTAEGTFMLKDLVAGGGDAYAGDMASVGDHLYVAARDGATTYAILKTDGTAAGTTTVVSNSAYAPYGLTDFNGRLAYATRSTGGNEYGLWVSDGTTAGTSLVRSFLSTGSHSLSRLTVFNDEMFFTVEDGVHGNEPWRSDGTPAGTTLIGDYAPGPAHGGAAFHTGFGNRLFFTATTPEIGSEPYVVTAPDATAPAAHGARFTYASRPHAVSVRFSEDVTESLRAGDLSVVNQTTGQAVPPGQIALSYDRAARVARFRFADLLADGRYRATIDRAAVTDPTGNALAGDVVLNFTFLRGDANGDGRVNLQDFNRLASNFGKSNRTFSQGDFNYDGTVNLLDFNILAGKFGAASAPAPALGVGGLASRGERDDSTGELLA